MTAIKTLLVEVLVSDQYGTTEVINVSTFSKEEALANAVDTINAMRFKVPFTIKLVEASIDKPDYKAISKYVESVEIASSRFPMIEPIVGDAFSQLLGEKNV